MSKLLFTLYFFFSLPLVLFAQDDLMSVPEAYEATEGNKDYLLLAKFAINDGEKIKFFQQALKAAKRENNSEKINFVLSEINNSWQPQREVTSSLRHALEELSFAEKKQNVHRIFTLNRLVGDIYLQEKSYLRTLDFYKKAENIIDNVPNNGIKATFATQIGDVYCAAKQYDNALPYYFEALRFFEKEKDKKDKQYHVLFRMMDACLAKKDYKALYGVAEKLLEKAKNNDLAIEAAALANQGIACHYQKDFNNAVKFFEEALRIKPAQQKYLDLAIIYADLAVAYQNTGEVSKSIQFLQKSIELAKSKNDKYETARLEHLLAGVHFQNKDFFNAQQYNNEALKKAQAIPHAELLAKTYELSARIYQNFYDYEPAFKDYRRYLDINDSLLFFERTRQKDLERQLFTLEKTEKELQLSLINQDIQALTIRQLQLDKERSRLENEKKDNELLLVKREQEIVAADLKNKALEAEKAQQALDLASQQLLQSEKDKALAILTQKEQLQKAELAAQDALLAQKTAEDKEKQRNIELLTKDKNLLLQQSKISDLELASQKAFRRNAYALGLLLSVIIGLAAFGYFLSRRNNRLLAQKNKEIEKEREKSDALLLNILPEKMATELKNTGEAKPRYYEKVSVLFADFTNFTQVAEKLTPQALIAELNDCFVNFDEIIEKHQLEKIKTIGDAYMCAGGIPEPNDTNPQNAVAAALDLMAFMKQRNAKKIANGELYWEMRIGINTGPVVAGVVGRQKFAYDIWGDAVNLASRLESASQPGKINISHSTYQAVQHLFHCTPRGRLTVKNKGEVTMYYVDK
jgi:adenylate cyclase